MSGANRGILIALEGIDGTGKSTQLRLLAVYLRDQGYTVIETREPTDGPCGREIRKLYMDRGQCSPEEELELFVRDRRQHVREIIEPGLAAGHIVLTDRYYFSTAAYQGAAGLDPDEVFARNSFAPRPDMVIILTMDPGVSMARIRDLRGEKLNEFEQEEQLYRVAALFESFRDPCIKRIDAASALAHVQEKIRTAVDDLLRGKAYQCIFS